jgi:hypothetical protein
MGAVTGYRPSFCQKDVPQRQEGNPSGQPGHEGPFFLFFFSEITNFLFYNPIHELFLTSFFSVFKIK